MITILKNKYRKSNKIHKCNFCGQDIVKGELYLDKTIKWQKKLYSFKSHVSCEYIATKLAEVCQTHVELSDDIFHEMCQDYCQKFVCPRCRFIDIYDECTLDNSYMDCMDKILDSLKRYKLVFDENSVSYKLVEGESND